MMRSFTYQALTRTLFALVILVLGGALAAGQAEAETPSTKLLTAPLVTPANAWAFYGTGQTHTNGPAAWQSLPPEIESLARSLGANRIGAGAGQMSQSQFIGNVSDYIRNGIETEFRFGLSKGGRGAFVDQSGTAFDQAELMVQLLARGGVTATYQVGTITLDAIQFSQWTGITEAAAACRLLADGGIPATVNGQGACTGLTGALTTVTLGHIWVSAGGALYDPAYKRRTFKSGLNLAAAIQCPAGGCGAKLAADVLSGATQSTLSGCGPQACPTIRNANEALSTADIAGYAQILQHYLEANLPEAELDDVVGGGRIDQTYAPTSGPSLPYASSVWSTWSAIPDQFRSKLHIVAGTIDITLYADEIATRRLRFLGGALYGDDIRIQSCGTCTGPDMLLEAIHPYAANGGAYARDSIHVPSGDVVSIVQGWGEAGPSTQKYMVDLQASDPVPPDWVANASGPCANSNCGGWEDQPLAITSILVQRSMANRIIGASGRANVSTHHVIGAITAFVDPALRSLSTNVLVSSGAGMSVTPTGGENAAPVFETASLMHSLIEGAVSQQARDSPTAVSAATVFVYLNRQGETFVNAPAGSTGDSNLWLSSATNEGYDVISTVRPGTYLELPLGVFWFDLAYKSDRNGYLLNDTLKGSGASTPTGLDLVDQALKTLKAADAGRKTKQVSFDLASGALNISPAPDLVSGAGDFPFSLPFQRTYSSESSVSERFDQANFNPWTYSGPDDDNGAKLGGGWTHNYQITARIGSNGQKAFGRDSGLDAAAAIAAIYTLNELFAAPNFPKRLAALFVANWLGTQLVGNTVTVTRPPATEVFVKLPDGRLRAPNGSASVLQQFGVRAGPLPFASGFSIGGFVWDYSPITLTYTDRTGSIVTFDTGSYQLVNIGSGTLVGEPVFKAVRWDFPNGVRISFNYAVEDTNWLNTGVIANSYRHYYLASVSNSFGRSLTIASTPTGPCLQWQIDSHGQLTGPCQRYLNVGQRITSVTDETGRQVRFAVSGCPTLPSPLTSMAMSCTTLTATDPLNFANRYEYAPDAISPAPSVIVRPTFRLRRLFSALDIVNGAGPMLRFGYDSTSHLGAQIDGLGRGTQIYPGGFFDGERYKRGEVIDPTGARTVSIFDERNNRTKVIDPIGRATTFAYDGMGRLTRTNNPEGDAEALTYDLRGNVLTSCNIMKAHSGLACNPANGDLRVVNTYLEGPGVIACANPATCNKVSAIADAKGLVTNYSWTNFGELSQILRPADPNGDRPRTDFGYTGFLIGPSGTVNLLTSKTEWITPTSSAVTAYTYNAANKHVLNTAVIDSGGLNLTTTFVFDGIGNLTSVNGPRPGSLDTTQYTWNSNRRLLFVVQPTAANGLRTATRHFYDPDGLLTDTYQGTATSADPASFTNIITRTRTPYDAVGNKLSIEVWDGTSANRLAVTQMRYDGADRVICTTVRLNPTRLNSPPSDACNLDVQSGMGPDRLTRNIYDAAGQLIRVEKGVGTGDGVVFQRYAYTPNGKRASLQDGAIDPSDPQQKGNLTTFVYDDFDRLEKQIFPVAASGQNQSNTADFEQYGYDANGNRTSLRRRDGRSLLYTYDNLNRMRTKSGPGLEDVTYSYDLRGRLVRAAFDAAAGRAIGFTYDKAGRKTVQNSYDWQVSYQYDEAGNRTRLTWPDGVFTAYAYDNADRLTTITQNGVTQLASFSYDAIGRRSRLDRTNQTATLYFYDAASRLTELRAVMPAGQPGDDEVMAYNPAGQVVRLMHADPFVWRGHPVSGSSERHDGLNRLERLTALGGYDANGNLTNDGVRTYGYDVENRLVGVLTGPVTTTESYDPLGKLRGHATSASGPRFFLLDGDNIIGEYAAEGLVSAGGSPAAAPLRRYVFGPGVDEPLVWYEGATPFWLHADRQGSILAWSDGAGVVLNAGAGINRTVAYGPYGEPSTWSLPRFAYTGQAAFAQFDRGRNPAIVVEAARCGAFRHE